MNDTVLYVGTTPTGVKVERREHGMFANGVFAKTQTRYFYGKDAETDAIASAERKAAADDDYRVRLGHGVDR